MTNRDAKFNLPIREFSWACFDALPSYQKAITHEFNVGWTGPCYPAFAKQEYNKLKEKRRLDTLLVYGADHPDCDSLFGEM